MGCGASKDDPKPLPNKKEKLDSNVATPTKPEPTKSNETSPKKTVNETKPEQKPSSNQNPTKNSMITPGLEYFSSTEPKRLSLDNHFREQIILTTPLEFSSSSCLIKGESKSTPQYFYVRFYLVSKKSIDSAETKIHTLTTIQKKLPHLLPCLFATHNPHYYYLMMENLGYEFFADALIKRLFKITEYNLSIAMKGIFETLREMHSDGLSHGRISPEKLLFKGNSFYLFDYTTGLESTSDLAFEGMNYLAPEVLFGEQPSPASDIWAMGSVLYYLITGHTPYPAATFDEYLKMIEVTSPIFTDPIWTLVSAEFTQIIQGMLNKNPEYRISLEKILDSKWITNPEIFKSAAVEIPFSKVFKEQIALQASLHEAINALANGQGKEDLEQLSNKLEEMDYTKSGLLNLSSLLGEVANPSYVANFKNGDIQVPYRWALLKAITLNQLIVPERVSVIFYKQTEGGTYMSIDKVKKIIATCGNSMIISNERQFIDLIRKTQITPRESVNLTYDELLKLFTDWRINISEESIWNVFVT